MEPWELTAREQIRDLVARYTWAGDRGRIDDLVALFLPSGVLDVGGHGGRWEGRAAIDAELRAVVARAATAGTAGTDVGTADSVDVGPGPVHHHVTSVLISDLAADSATVRSYYAVHTVTGPDHWGRYRDRVVRTGTAWAFAERIVTVDGAAPGSRFVDA